MRLRLRQLDRRLGLLDGLRAGLDRDTYRADVAVQAQVERHLQIAVQAAIDVAAHIVAEDTAEVPADYASTFTILARSELLDAQLAERLAQAAGQRNVLVHGYAEVDHDMVWASLTDLDDLRDFAREIEAYLPSKPGDG